MKTLLTGIDTTQDDLEIKFGLTKQELEKEIDIRKDIVKIQKEKILKHLISKTVDGVKNEELLHEKKRDRLLNIRSVQLHLPSKNDRSLVSQQQSTENTQAQQTKSNGQTVDPKILMKSVESQQQSIQKIMDALQSLASFKQDVQKEIGSIAKDIGKIKGKKYKYISCLLYTSPSPRDS